MPIPDILATVRLGAVVAALTLIAKQFRRGVPGLRPRHDSTCRAKPLGLAGLPPAGLADDGEVLKKTVFMSPRPIGTIGQARENNVRSDEEDVPNHCGHLG